MSRQRQIEVRKERARCELPRCRITNTRPSEMLSLYRVRSGSGYTYDVEIRNPFESENRCSCPDYESNGLGTCKHIEAVLIHLEREPPDEFRAQRARLAEEKARKVALQLAYKDEVVIRASFDPALEKPVCKAVGAYFTKGGLLHDKDLSWLVNFGAEANRRICRAYQDWKRQQPTMGRGYFPDRNRTATTIVTPEEFEKMRAGG
jgi:hypothetical protein